jgi:predicted metalloprotease
MASMGTTNSDFRNRFIGAVVATVMAFGAVAGVTGGRAGAQVSKPYDAPIDQTIAGIQGFWAAAFPDAYGEPYDGIPVDRVLAYSSSDPPPNCEDGGRTRMPYEEVAGNAFYCGNGDFIAYDEEALLPKLREHFGEFAVGLVLAHEFGHAVQARVGYMPSATVYMEQQADCFAGAWAQHVAESDDEDVHLSTQDLDTALAGLLTLSDPSGVDGLAEGAHGNGFDRVSAFQDGYERGVGACAAYVDEPPEVTEAGYASYADQASGGNLPLDELLPTVTRSLEDYWASQSSELTAPALTASAGPATHEDSDGGVLTDAVTYRSSSNAVYYDADTFQDVYESIGDFGGGMLLATAWASSVQHQLGEQLDTDSARRGAECLAGAWAAHSSSSLSPGDLDEAVTVLVAAGRGGASDQAGSDQAGSDQGGSDQGSDRGTAFDRVAAFRAGFKHGPSRCVQSS